MPSSRCFSQVVFAAQLLVLGIACGGSSITGNFGGNPGGGSGGNNPPPSSVPQFSHVVVVVEENAGYEDVVGSDAMPYLNGLATKYGLATNYYANAHPSIGNYFMMTTGDTVTHDDAFSGAVSADNLVRQFVKDGKSWKFYAESLPSTGYLGGDSYPYLKRHVPAAYFSDLANDPSLARNVVPFSDFGADLASGNLPNFAFVTPNAKHDAHDCPSGGSVCLLRDRLAVADDWLETNIAPLIASSVFSDTLLIIVFDEAQDLDLRNGGGHVAAVLVSPKVKGEFQGNGQYQHQSLERLIGDALRLSAVPGAGSSAPSMSEFFQ